MSTYKFGESFQTKILALMLREPTFLRTYFEALDPKFFDFDYLTSLTRLVLEYFRKHDVPPTKEALLEEFSRFCTQYNVDTGTRDRLIGVIDRSYELDLSDADYITGKVVNFGRRQALRGSVMEVIELLKDEDSTLDSAEDLIKKALGVGTNTRDMGMLLYQSLPDLPALINATPDPTVKRKIPTLLPTFDRVTNGGPGIGEVWMPMGLPGVGKSIFVMNMGANAAMQGIPVVHFTIADLQEADVAVRYAARISKVNIDDIMSGSPEYYARVADLIKYNPYIRIKHYPAKGVDTRGLRSFLSQVTYVDKVKPGVVIVDYPDKLKRKMLKSGYEELGDVYDDLNAIANDFDCLVWAPSQPQRWSPTGPDDVITKEKVGDSWLKSANADGILSLNQTVVERHLKPTSKIRIWLDKVRRGESMQLIPCNIDYKHMIIREILDDKSPA